MEDVKAYSHALKPKSLDNKLGIISAIDSLVQIIRRQLLDTKCHCTYNFDARVPLLIEINLYRANQEALHNMMKYAHAQNVNINASKENSQIVVKMIDDGIGFAVKEKNNGLGLMHIKERISQLKGYIEISSEPGKGTEIIMTIPIREGFIMKILIVDDHELTRKGIKMLPSEYDNVSRILEAKKW